MPWRNPGHFFVENALDLRKKKSGPNMPLFTMWRAWSQETISAFLKI